MYYDDLISYVPKNEQEVIDKQMMVSLYNDYHDELLFRTSTFAHFTASCFILNKTKDKVLFSYHNIFKAWGWLGGHADGDNNLLNVALKEAHEESGLINIKPLYDFPVSLEVLPVYYHIKNGKFVSSHLHLNLTYLLIADEQEQLRIKEDENSGLKWVDFKTCFLETDEEVMKPIYKKIYNNVKKIEND